jgi:hypothetical protein
VSEAQHLYHFATWNPAQPTVPPCRILIFPRHYLCLLITFLPITLDGIIYFANRYDICIKITVYAIRIVTTPLFWNMAPNCSRTGHSSNSWGVRCFFGLWIILLYFGRRIIWVQPTDVVIPSISIISSMGGGGSTKVHYCISGLGPLPSVLKRI